MKPHLAPIRHTTSQPAPSPSKRSIHDDWFGGAAAGGGGSSRGAAGVGNYDAETDPYCPHTRSDGYKKQKKVRSRLEKELKLSRSQHFLQDPKAGPGALDPSFKPMERPRVILDAPIHTVSNLSKEESGLTFSAEPVGRPEEGMAELEVLKAIINREGYLARLIQCVRSISKKFKPEVADILDFVRAASLDVVEAIVRWRDVKNDHEAAFVWNGMNYLLKMPSDLDYLAEYRAVQNWLGFDIIRNPFCIPFPMEKGAMLFSDAMMNPKHVDTASSAQATGFSIGGMLASRYNANYALPADEVRRALSPATPARTGLAVRKDVSRGKSTANMASFVLNEDMVKLRQSELVILKEEKRHGQYTLDPSGRLMQKIQADTLFVAHDLAKDNYRDMEEKAETSKIAAPHAGIGGVGYSDRAWDPTEVARRSEDNVRRLEEIGKTRPVDPISKLKKADMLPDYSLTGAKRGRDKNGGVLTPLDTKPVQASVRLPLKPNNDTGNELQFKLNRKKSALSQRLGQITELRESLAKEVALLNAAKQNSRQPIRSQRSASETSEQLAEAHIASDNSNALMSATTPITSGSIPVGAGKDAAKLLSQTAPLSKIAGSAVPGRRNSGMSRSLTESRAGESTEYTGEDEEDDSLISEEDSVSVEEDTSHIPPELKEEIRKLEEERDVVTNEYNRVLRKEAMLLKLKENQRLTTEQERSRDIERKRRLLTAEEGRRRGPPPAYELDSVYDYFATIAQTTVRGWLARRWYTFYRGAVMKASILLQTIVRGWLARTRIGRLMVQSRACRHIQRLFRGFKARKESSLSSNDYKMSLAATTIQRIYRGRLAIKRVAKKRQLDQAAKAAIECVSPQNLFIEDIIELAKRIQMAIEEPFTTSFPPDEVLYLIRLATCVLLTDEGAGAVSTYSTVGARYYEELQGAKLTWLQGMKILNRSNRFIRRVRAIAFAPVARPPRMVKINEDTILLYKALKNNPRWCVGTFESIGLGSKLCTQMFKWITSMIDVSTAQQEFANFLVNSFPDWLPQFLELQQNARRVELDLAVLLSVVETVQAKKDREDEGDETLMLLYHHEMDELSFMIHDATERLKEYHDQEEQLRQEQNSIENSVLSNLNAKLIEKEEIVEILTGQFEQLVEGARKGDRLMEAKLPEFRARLISAQIEFKEVRSQFTLSKLQVENNRNLRLDKARLPQTIKSKGRIHGEARGVLSVTRVKMKAMLQNADVKFDHMLAKIPGALEAYKELEKREDIEKIMYRKTKKVADVALEEHDRLVNKAVKEKDRMQKVDTSQFVPTDAEMLEERDEDEAQAKAERFKRMQYVPDAVLYEQPQRERPLLLCFSRDLPGYAKNKLIHALRESMPGVFMLLDRPDKMGLDINDMQDALDAKKSIMMTVDPGLTRITRSTFLKSFEMVTQTLIPKPHIVFVYGDERNKRSPLGDQYFGVSSHDLACSTDGDIKRCMESLTWLQETMLTPEVRILMKAQSESTVTMSVPFVTVMEAFYIIQSDQDNFRSPDYNIPAVSGKATRRLFDDPLHLVSRLKEIKRAKASSSALAVLEKYLAHRMWPSPIGEERQTDQLLNIVAMYVEVWTECERLTMLRGGIPDKLIAKGDVSGLICSIALRDAMDEDENLESTSGGGWRAAFAGILKGCLQDLRVLKLVHKIEGKIYNVTVYREDKQIFFDCYDPMTSQIYSTIINITDVPQLLVPNSTMLSRNPEKKEPPSTTKEMYTRLVRLLRFEKATKLLNARRVLVCRRDNTFLMSFKAKINGHMVLVSAYEGALGEVLFEGYFQENAARVLLTVDDETRLRMTKNYDSSLELHVSEDAKALDILPYMADRLQVFPPRRCMLLRRDNLVGAGETDPWLSKALELQNRHQGIKLKLRTRGGPGKLLYQRVHNITGLPVVLTIRLSTFTNTLRILAYEPRTKTDYEVRMNTAERQMLLGSAISDKGRWIKVLVRKLRIRWHLKKLNLHVNNHLHRALRTICGRKHIMNLYLQSEDTFKIVLTDMQTMRRYSALIRQDEATRITSFKLKEAGKYDADLGELKGVAENVKQLLRYMMGQSTEETDSSGVPFDASLLDMEIHQLYTDKRVLRRLLDQISRLLEFKNPLDYTQGYGFKAPVRILFAPVEPTEDEQDEIDDVLIAKTEGKFIDDINGLIRLRNNPRLVQAERAKGCHGDVVRARIQPPVVYMEPALDEMALSLAKASKLASENAKTAAEKLQMSLETEVIEPFLAELEKTPLEGENADPAVVKKEALDSHITDISDAAAVLTADHIISILEHKEWERDIEREAPGTIQEEYMKTHIHGPDGSTLLKIKDLALEEQEKAILARRADQIVLEAGVKTIFKNGKARWHGHVSVTAYEGLSFDSYFGVGRRFRIVVYDPASCTEYEGIIRSTKHIYEILGQDAMDLTPVKRTKEMLLFIFRNRMNIVANETTWDGEPVEEGALKYRVEFESQRVYSNQKVTPLNAGGDVDIGENDDKNIVEGDKRGRKLLRVAKRITGLLLQLVVFELPLSKEEEEAQFHMQLELDKQEAKIQEEIQRLKPKLAGAEGEEGDNPGMAKMMEHRRQHRLERYTAPSFRIVGYDPRAKVKCVYPVPTAAVIEIAGGAYSRYLEPSRRRELARIVCDGLQCIFSKGSAFQLFLPYSGTSSLATGAPLFAKKSIRAPADQVIKRPGKLFRSAMRISLLDLVVTVFAYTPANKENAKGTPVAKPTESEDQAEESAEKKKDGTDATEAAAAESEETGLIFNFYAPICSESVDVFVSDKTQVSYLGKRLMNFPEGFPRSMAIRKLCNFFRAHIGDDHVNIGAKVLFVELLPLKGGFIQDYKQVGLAEAGMDIRPVGIPEVFMPPDICGTLMHRRGTKLYEEKTSRMSERDFVVSVYSKSHREGLERGVVVKLYDKNDQLLVILHVGPSEIQRLIEKEQEYDLLRDIADAKSMNTDSAQDELEQHFSTLTEKAENQRKLKSMYDRFSEIIINDLGVYIDSFGQTSAYLITARTKPI